jgi:hypothetical protein
MSKKKQQRRRELKVELAQGQKKYVLYNGVLGWGIPTYFLYLFISAIVQMFFYRALARQLSPSFPSPSSWGSLSSPLPGSLLADIGGSNSLRKLGASTRTRSDKSLLPWEVG